VARTADVQMVKVSILDHIKVNDLRQECNFLRD